MVTKINTPPLQATGGNSSSGSSSNSLIYILVGAVVLYLGYKYVIKPSLEKKEAEKQ